jgi:integrase
MVQLQQLTGMRPGEVCAMTPGDIDMSGDPWVYRPRHHKTAHHGHERRILVGLRGHAIPRCYLTGELTVPVFRPEQAHAERNAARRAAYVPKPGSADYRSMPSYQQRRALAKPVRFRDRWTPGAYGLAVRRAYEAAGVPHWSPNQLRHAAATRVRKAGGLEVAQVVLGHKHASVTKIYAEVDMKRAADLVQRLG